MVTTFSETSVATSKKDVVKRGMNNSKCFKNYDLNWSQSPFLLYNNSLKMLILVNNVLFLPLRWRMVATFSETRPFTSRDHIEKRVWAFQNDQKNLL